MTAGRRLLSYVALLPQQPLNFALVHAVVPPGRARGADAAPIDPLLEGGVAHPEPGGGLARRQERHRIKSNMESP
jgi:hypothetical protein